MWLCLRRCWVSVFRFACYTAVGVAGYVWADFSAEVFSGCIGDLPAEVER